MTMGSFKFQVTQETLAFLHVPLTQGFSNFLPLGMLLVSESGKMRKSFFFFLEYANRSLETCLHLDWTI